MKKTFPKLVISLVIIINGTKGISIPLFKAHFSSLQLAVRLRLFCYDAFCSTSIVLLSLFLHFQLVPAVYESYGCLWVG